MRICWDVWSISRGSYVWDVKLGIFSSGIIVASWLFRTLRQVCSRWIWRSMRVWMVVTLAISTVRPISYHPRMMKSKVGQASSLWIILYVKESTVIISAGWATPYFLYTTTNRPAPTATNSSISAAAEAYSSASPTSPHNNRSPYAPWPPSAPATSSTTASTTIPVASALVAKQAAISRVPNVMKIMGDVSDITRTCV